METLLARDDFRPRWLPPDLVICFRRFSIRQLIEKPIPLAFIRDLFHGPFPSKIMHPVPVASP
jgi:hypothetical protein